MARLQQRLALGCGAGRSWRHEIFAGYDLPFPASPDPGVRPDELSASPILLLPSPVALRYGRVSVEANLDFVEMVEDEFGRMSAEILDAIRFGIMAAVDVHSDEVISEDALENADVIRDGGLGQVRLSLSYIGSIAGVVIGQHMRPGRTEQKKNCDQNRGHWEHLKQR